MTLKRTRVRADELVLDYESYPRHRPDPMHVRALRDALDAGTKLPPIVAEADSLVVVDGFHRVHAELARDPDAIVLVELHTYPSPAARFLDAVTRNAKHGLRLQSYDRARCLTVAASLGIDDDAIAGALSVTVDVTAKLRASRTAYDGTGAPVEIKRPFRRFAGKTLDDRQIEANRRSSGWPARYHAEQIVTLLDAGAVELDDEATAHALRECVHAIERALAVDA